MERWKRSEPLYFSPESMKFFKPNFFGNILLLRIHIIRVSVVYHGHEEHAAKNRTLIGSRFVVDNLTCIEGTIEGYRGDCQELLGPGT